MPIDADLPVQYARELEALAASGGLAYSPLDYLTAYRELPVRGYAQFATELLQMETCAEQRDERLPPALNRYLLASQLAVHDPDNAPLSLPQAVRARYRDERQRIQQCLENAPQDYFRLRCDTFTKDLAVLDFRLIPLGAEYAAPGAGISRRLLFAGGLAQGLRFAGNALLRYRSLSGYLELHAHPGRLQEFNEPGWRDTLALLASLVQANPGIRGVVSSSWFLDPRLAQISPRLAYLRRQSLDTGADLYFCALDSEGTTGALATSATRRQLFAQGNYTPRIYTRIWSRQRLLGNSYKA